MKSISLTILLLFSINIHCQNIKGLINDEVGNPIVNASVFVKGINQGIISNDEGEFQLSLPTGNYIVIFQSIGYKTLEKEISIKSNETTEINIVLMPHQYELKEIVVSNKEDPAYEIMRKAIAKAPYYEKAVSEYVAESYIKGTFELLKISGLVDKMTKVDNVDFKLSDLVGKLFFQESYNEIKFTYPDKYIQTVKAFSSTIPDDLEPKNTLNLLNNSIYRPKFTGIISPLNPKALSYYKFRYEGFIEEGHDIINKIKVIAKYNNPELANGYIYIADNTWDIRNVELEATLWGMNNNFKISYSDVGEQIYMPSAYKNFLKFDLLGIEGYFNYNASIKYISITSNIETVIDKEEQIKKKRNFEIAPDTLNYKIKVDTLATKRDSLYWIDIRNVPLSDKEIYSYNIKDSIQNKFDSLRNEENNASFHLSSLLTGGKIGGDSTRFEFRYGGISNIYKNYNFVDGFRLGQKFSLSTKIGNLNKLIFTPEAYYATARKSIIYQVDFDLLYAPMKQGKLSLSGGSISSDFNPDGISRVDNAFGSLLWGRNYNMLYKNNFISINNSIDLANGLKLNTGFISSKRTGLNNNTDFHIKIAGKPFGDFFLLRSSHKRIKPNFYFPEASYLNSYKINLEYSPFAYYTIDKGRKQYRYVTSPTFSLTYTEGLSLNNNNNSVFRKLETNIKQSIKLGYFSKMYYSVGGGTFIGNKSDIHQIDLKGMNTSDIIWMIKRPDNTFLMLDAYRYSTNKHWLYAHTNYSSQYLLLKRLPFLQGTMLQENLYLKFLHTPDLKSYSEIGYSIDFLSQINLGIFASFDKLKFIETNIRLITTFDISK